MSCSRCNSAGHAPRSIITAPGLKSFGSNPSADVRRKRCAASRWTRYAPVDQPACICMTWCCLQMPRRVFRAVTFVSSVQSHTDGICPGLGQFINPNVTYRREFCEGLAAEWWAVVFHHHRPLPTAVHQPARWMTERNCCMRIQTGSTPRDVPAHIRSRQAWRSAAGCQTSNLAQQAHLQCDSNCWMTFTHVSMQDAIIAS